MTDPLGQGASLDIDRDRNGRHFNVEAMLRRITRVVKKVVAAFPTTPNGR